MAGDLMEWGEARGESTILLVIVMPVGVKLHRYACITKVLLI
jgi:hypothetical protein